MTTLQSENCQTNDLNDLFPMSIESLRFPLDNSIQIIFTGYYNGYNVEVRSPEEITLLYHMGCFGKGSASRSRPTLVNSNRYPEIIRKRQYLQRNNWYKKFGDGGCTLVSSTLLKELDELSAKIVSDGEKLKKKDIIDLVSSDEEFSHDDVDTENAVNQSFSSSEKDEITVVIPNSDSEEENYFAALKPQCCVNKIKMQEKLILTPEEAFFLAYGLGSLQVVYNNNILDLEQCWTLLCSNDRHFVDRYVVYHYFRSKGYVVKPGIKFGGDFLLYKDGPGIRHADYIIVIKSDTKQDDLITILGHVRVATTTVKEILLVEVLKPNGVTSKLPESLHLYHVKEVLLTRNIPMTINNDD